MFKTWQSVNEKRKHARSITRCSDPEDVQKYFRNMSGKFETQNQTHILGMSEKSVCSDIFTLGWWDFANPVFKSKKICDTTNQPGYHWLYTH